MLLQIETKKVDPDITVLELKGRVTLGRETSSLETLVKELREADVRKLVFDMSAIDYVDSSGLGMLTFCFATMKKSGGAFRIAAPNDRVRQLLKFTHLDTVLPIDASAEESCQKLREVAATGA
jgi:anti-sigma B factor antagonist